MNETADWLFRRGKSLIEAGSYGDAIPYLREATRMEPDEARYHSALADAHRDAGDFGAALQEAECAVHLDPHGAEYHSKLSWVYSCMENHDGAVQEANRAVDLDPDDAAYHFRLALVYNQAENWDGALQEAKTAVDLDPEKPYHHAMLADAYAGVGNADEAIHAISRAIELDPDQALWHGHSARVHNILGNRDGALQEANRAIDLDAGLGEAYYERGLAHLSLHRLPDALNDCWHALLLDPSNTEALELRAGVYTFLQEYEHALADFAALHKRCPVRPYVCSPEEERTVGPWFEAIHDHFKEEVMPRLDIPAGESVTKYWPCYLLWDMKVREGVSDGTSYREYYASSGTGYLCLTDRNVHLVSIGELSQRYPLHSKGRSGFFGEGLDRCLLWKSESSDRHWVIANHSITSVEPIFERLIELQSTVGAWAVMSYFVDEWGQLMRTALSMISSGRPSVLGVAPPSVSQRSQDEETLKLLDQLRQLRAAGVFSEEEFEAKKRALLARL